MSRDRNKLFFSARTGEVVPAGTDEVAGKVVRNRDGSFTAHAFGRASGSKRCATQDDAIVYVIKESRG